MIDIGANLTSERFRDDLETVLERTRAAGVNAVIVTGTSVAESHEALALARGHGRAHPGFLYTTAGVHPHVAKTWSETCGAELKRLAQAPEVVALGECGLDFNRDFSPRADQLHCFEAQLALAAEIGKPVFLHQRDAHEAFMPILRRYRDRLAGAVVHCFTGTGEELDDYLGLDCHIGITGWLCDKRRGETLRALVARIPAQRLMIETDAPYLTPQNRPQKPKGNRNEPALLPYVLEQLAECRGESPGALAAQTLETTRAFFGLE